MAAPDQTFAGIDWGREAKNILKAAMKRHEVSYKLLADKFQQLGSAESEANLRNKMSRGTFTASFFLQCLAVMNVRHIDLSEHQ